MTETKEDIAVPLSAVELRAVEKLCALEHKERSTLLEELIEEGLHNRTLRLYEKGKITLRKGAEIFGVSLREFLELLENRGIAINWDSKSLKKYLITSGYLKSKEEIISILQTLKPTLSNQYNVETIGVFGSYVHDEQSPRSDIDILVTFKEHSPIGLFKFLELEELLAKKLATKVDLVSKDALKPHIGKHILEEVIMV